MTAALLAIAWCAKAALVAVLVAVLVRRRDRECWSFVAYLVVVLSCEMLATLWPSTFFTPEWWMAKQALYDAAKVVVAGELAWRALRAFPRVMRTAQVFAMMLLPVSVLLVVGLPARSFLNVAEWQPRMVVGTAALFSITAMMTMWYHLPVRPWHRALVMGFSVYLLAFVVLLNVLRLEGWRILPWVNLLDGAAYVGILAWWALEAWRPEPVLAGIPVSVLRRLGVVSEAR